MQDLIITLIQTDLIWENKEKNLTHFKDKIYSIMEDTDLIILPEMFSTGFSMNPAKLAEPMDGPTVNWLQKISADQKTDICGSVIIKEDGKYFNRLIWTKPDGSLFIYNKRHLFRMGNEPDVYSAGEKLITVELKEWKIRPLICYDLRFPVWARNTSGSEYDLLIYVANWPDKRTHHWKSLLTARAIENQAYVAGVNRIGSDGNNVSYSGDSMIVDPLGKTLAFLRNQDSIHTERLSKRHLLDYRERFPAWKDGDKFEIK
ncbi:MAG: amidohydrolase [Calditrichaceae bacterium]|nr:amidohydrolase [Calditrichaceae bacterium]